MSRRRFFTPQQTYDSFFQSLTQQPPPQQPQTASQQQPVQPQQQHQPPSALVIPSSFPSSLPSEASSSLQPPLRNAVSETSPLVNRIDSVIRRRHREGGSDGISHWLSRRNLDSVVSAKSTNIFITAVVGIVFGIAVLQFGWDGRVYVDDDVATSVPLIFACKVGCSLSTILLLYQILDRKQLQATIKYREKRRKKSLHAAVSENKVTIMSLLSLRPSQFRWPLWLQLIVCLIHPAPFLSSALGVPNTIALLMFLRLHLFFRVMRDRSDIWLNRRSINRIAAFSARTPTFDWWLAVKTYCYRKPIQFALAFYAASILIFGYSIYILERSAQPELFTFPIGLFLAYQCITIDWAADVYDEYNPRTWIGKLTCLFAAMMGLLLTSFIIGFVSQQIQPSRFEEDALVWIGVEKVREKEREAAARLIQLVWRSHRRQVELEEKLAVRNPRLYEELSENEEKEFMEEFISRCKEMRLVKRERTELEEQIIVKRMKEDDERARERALGRERELEHVRDRSVWLEGIEEVKRMCKLMLADRERRRGRRERNRLKRRRGLGVDGADTAVVDVTGGAAGSRLSRKSRRRGELEEVDDLINADATLAPSRQELLQQLRERSRRRSVSYGEVADLETVENAQIDAAQSAKALANEPTNTSLSLSPSPSPSVSPQLRDDDDDSEETSDDHPRDVRHLAQFAIDAMTPNTMRRHSMTPNHSASPSRSPHNPPSTLTSPPATMYAPTQPRPPNHRRHSLSHALQGITVIIDDDDER